MRMQKISTSFGNYSDANLEQKAEYIHERMTGNEFFELPTPTLAKLQDAITLYSAALLAAGGFDRPKVALKNEARQQLEVLLAKLGMYVMNVALGNVAMLTSSGYTLIKTSEPRYIPNPGNVTIENGGTSGELTASVAGVLGAKSYQHQVATALPAEGTEWVSVPGSTAKHTYTEL